MNRSRISLELQRRIDAHVDAGGDRRDPSFRRIVDLVRRMRRTNLERKYRTAPTRLEGEILAPLRRRLDRIRIVAIDTEWSPDGPAFDELGIAVWDGARIETVENIRTGPPRTASRRILGAQLHHDVDRSLGILTARLAGADMLVMHAGRNDRIRLRMAGYELPRITVVDTMTWHRMATGERSPASLGAICDRWSIPHASRHVASNDALATLRIVLSMIRQGPAPVDAADMSDVMEDMHPGSWRTSVLDRATER